MIFGIYILLPLALLIFSSVISHVLLLLLMVIITLSFVASFCSANTLLLLVVFTVYVGAIVTLFVYVSAMCPNDYITKSAYSSLLLLFIGGAFLTIGGSLVNYRLVSLTPFLNCVSSEIFTGFGIYMTGVLTLLLLMMLLVSTYITPSVSTFRSLA